MELRIGAEDKCEGVIDLVTMKAHYYDGENGEKIRTEEVPADLLEQAKTMRHDLIAAAAEHDDKPPAPVLGDKEPAPQDSARALGAWALPPKLTPGLCRS